MRRIPVLATVLAAWVLAGPAVSPAQAAAPTPKSHASAPKPSASPDGPLLSITVDDGRTAVAAGDELTYRLTVRNLGASTVADVKVSQSLPTGLTLVSADRGGKARDGAVTWATDLKVGQESTFTTVARVGETPKDLLRLATVACATAKGGTKPLVCATHSDLLPAGAVAPVAEDTGTSWVWYAGAAAALLIIGLGAFALLRRYRRRRVVPAHAHPASRPTENTDRMAGAVSLD
ncbi:DUF11 domain-containing protein [Micromonospora parathelypteridis]|uniref:Putative repeat protein (TIGR01451 family) n=1 Tax=Micromonospora parathelypteridis TaxID=1839617 RepID=A0A840VYL9_9ACTN|nr:DUF11 domain-containing protein [Micromonospora parathelypteridis]MBB5476091.1 putative repeat protein (TIGR01451 family) [Micromonospora parathelypteridis]GGO32695.1 hypothetical protein GCM10011576_63500 [Micromonospora parathelypteridis]